LVVDDEESPFVAARECDDALRLHRSMEGDIEQPYVVVAVPRAELKRFIAAAGRPPEQNQEIAGLLVVRDVADALLPG